MELAWQDSTRSLGWVPFWPTSAPPPAEEVPLGLCHSGGVFAFDPFALVARGYLSGPNVLVVGEIGQGKSTVVKLLLARSEDRSRSLLVLDPKGEYATQAPRLAAEVVHLAGDGGVDPFAGCDRRAPRVASTLGRLARLGLGRELVPLERILVGQLARALLESLDPPSLVAARDLLARRHLVGRLPLGVQAEAEGRGLELLGALDRLLEGDLAGVFAPDGAVRALPPRAVVAIDPTWDRALAAAAVAALIRARGVQLAGGQVAPGYIVLDEAWSLLVDPEAVREIRSLFKLARAYGASLVALTHRLSDLTGEARGIVEDAETRVVLRQSPGEQAVLREGLGLAGSEVEQILGLHRGQALWLLGRHRFLVTHLVLEEERALVDTDGRMR
jgi:hypothetical protein